MLSSGSLEHFIVKWNHLTAMKMRKNKRMERFGCFLEAFARASYRIVARDWSNEL